MEAAQLSYVLLDGGCLLMSCSPVYESRQCTVASILSLLMFRVLLVTQHCYIHIYIYMPVPFWPESVRLAHTVTRINSLLASSAVTFSKRRSTSTRFWSAVFFVYILSLFVIPSGLCASSSAPFLFLYFTSFDPPSAAAAPAATDILSSAWQQVALWLHCWLVSSDWAAKNAGRAHLFD